MPYIVSEKIKIGISACNFGCQVRYNQRGWYRAGLLGRDNEMFSWSPFCPEVMAGLGVPRAPIKLTGGNGDDFWAGQAKVKNRFGRDVGADLMAAEKHILDMIRKNGLEAYVFMEGSPTCGVYRTTLKDKRLGKPPGTFGSLLLHEGLFLIPAADLESPLKWWDWRRRLLAFIWLKHEPLTAKSQLTAIWHDLKFICQEISRLTADKIGRELAGQPRIFSPAWSEVWRQRVLNLFRQPSSLNRILNSLGKHHAYYCHQAENYACRRLALNTETSKYKIIEAIKDIESYARGREIIFAGAPVVFRTKR